MKGLAINIPENLIYEMVEGKPIYYKGYKDFLNGKKSEENMGSSYLQAWLVTKLTFLFMSTLADKYEVLASELGLQFSKKTWRCVDIAIYPIEALRNRPLTDKYLDIPPKIVVEIDTKAELSDQKDPISYYHEKTAALLNFGVEKVIWIFTETKTVIVVENNNIWEINDWTKEVEILEGMVINLEQIVERK